MGKFIARFAHVLSEDMLVLRFSLTYATEHGVQLVQSFVLQQGGVQGNALAPMTEFGSAR